MVLIYIHTRIVICKRITTMCIIFVQQKVGFWPVHFDCHRSFVRWEIVVPWSSAGLLDQPMCLPEDFSHNATDHGDDHHRRLGGGAGATWDDQHWGPADALLHDVTRQLLREWTFSQRLYRQVQFRSDSEGRIGGARTQLSPAGFLLIYVWLVWLVWSQPGLGSPHSVIISVPFS